MYLVVGATGKLGKAVVRLLCERGCSVRAMVREPAAADDLRQMGAEVVQGDLRDVGSMTRACYGAEKVLDAAQAFPGTWDNNLDTVDRVGKRYLIAAARYTGVRHFVFTSAVGARSSHPRDFLRAKGEIEAHLRLSGLSYTILRATPFMETWAARVGQPVLERGDSWILGNGDNPINFVSVADVARYALIALDDPGVHNRTLEVGGPENLTYNQVVSIFETVSGRHARRRHLPLSVMVFAAAALRPWNPPLRHLLVAAILQDTQSQAFDMNRTLWRYPMRLTRLEEVARRMADRRKQIAAYQVPALS